MSSPCCATTTRDRRRLRLGAGRDPRIVRTAAARYRGAVERPRYDTIGTGYARTRRDDPRLRARIHAALGDARTVVNVGAGQ